MSRLPSWESGAVAGPRLVGVSRRVGDLVSSDVLPSAASGYLSGVEGLLGLGGDIRHAIDYGTLWATAHAMEEAGQLPKGQTADHFIRRNRGSYMRAFLNKLGVSNASIDAASQAVAPTTEDVHGAVKSLGVPDYTPQTTTGKYANTVASFLPGVLGTPASGPLELAANAARYAVVPGIASEAAGQATEGNSVRTLGSLGWRHGRWQRFSDRRKRDPQCREACKEFCRADERCGPARYRGPDVAIPIHKPATGQQRTGGSIGSPSSWLRFG